MGIDRQYGFEPASELPAKATFDMTLTDMQAIITVANEAIRQRDELRAEVERVGEENSEVLTLLGLRQAEVDELRAEIRMYQGGPDHE